MTTSIANKSLERLIACGYSISINGSSVIISDPLDKDGGYCLSGSTEEYNALLDEAADFLEL